MNTDVLSIEIWSMGDIVRVSPILATILGPLIQARTDIDGEAVPILFHKMG